MKTVSQLIKEIKKCPAMYVGYLSLTAVAHYLHGYIDAIKDYNESQGNHEYISDMREFSIWVGKRYGISASVGYWRIILLFNHNEHEALKVFFELFEEFENSANANTKSDSDDAVVFQGSPIEVMQWLTEQSEDVGVNAVTVGGATSMHRAADSGHIDMMKWLKGQVGDVNAKDDCGATPMFYAAVNGHVDAMKWLKEQGADINAKTNCGKTSLRYAEERNQENAVEWLKANGAE